MSTVNMCSKEEGTGNHPWFSILKAENAQHSLVPAFLCYIIINDILETVMDIFNYSGILRKLIDQNNRYLQPDFYHKSN